MTNNKGTIPGKPCDEPCPKCGSSDIFHLFIAKGDAVPHGEYGKCKSKYATGYGHYWRATRDHMHHHCRCCGFAWQGRPLGRERTARNARVDYL